jgi:hypothetical protein
MDTTIIQYALYLCGSLCVLSATLLGLLTYRPLGARLDAVERAAARQDAEIRENTRRIERDHKLIAPPPPPDWPFELRDLELH